MLADKIKLLEEHHLELIQQTRGASGHPGSAQCNHCDCRAKILPYLDRDSRLGTNLPPHPAVDHHADQEETISGGGSLPARGWNVASHVSTLGFSATKFRPYLFHYNRARMILNLDSAWATVLVRSSTRSVRVLEQSPKLTITNSL